MIPDALDFITRGTDDQQAEYAAAHDWRILPEPQRRVVLDNSSDPWSSHSDGRMCGYYRQIGKWSFEGFKECLRAHPNPKTTVPAAEGEANAGAVKPSVTPAPSPCTGVADTDPSDADAVGALASEVQTCEGAHGKPNREAEVDTSALGNDDGKCCGRQAPGCSSSSPLGSASTPRWSAVDDETADLLSLVASEHPATPSEAKEWHRFTQALEAASDLDGRIDPNFLRPLLRGSVAPNRIGAFTNRAKAEGLIAWGGEWITSDDTEGRNSGKPCRVYRWLGAAS